METTTNLFQGFRHFESFLPPIARAGIFSPGAQKYAREEQGALSSNHRPSAVVLSRRDETVDTVSLTLLPAENYPAFRAGQHIDVAVEVRGVRETRQYSLTGAQGAGTLQITVKRQDAGLVSNYLHDHATSGTRIEISLPRGEFVMNSNSAAAYAFFSAGSGITPVFAMARALLQTGSKADAYFFHAAKSKSGIIFRSEIERLAEEFSNFKPYFFLSEENNRRLNFAAAESLMPIGIHPRDTEIYICGPGEFVKNLETGFSGSGYAAIQTEYYTLPAAPAAEGSARFLRSRASIATETNLLEAAEAAGIKAKHGCRRGICHECKAHKRSGTVKNILTGKETSGREDIQLCITQPVGIVEIDI